MIAMILDEIAATIGAAPAGPLGKRLITGVGTDSRRVEPGQVFFAIRGDRFDGHDYVAQALASGAAAAVVSRPVNAPGEVCIRVDDTVAALGKLAAVHRRRLTATVIAVTGSNGKTTTKNLVHHVLGTRLRGRAAAKSYNNHLGVPLTLLSARADDEYLVVEIGSNAPGEVAHLTRLATPDVAVITSIGPAHLAGFGGLDGVVREKASILRAVPPGGLGVVNADHPQMRAWLEGRHKAQGTRCEAQGTRRKQEGNGSSVVAELLTFGRTAGVDLRVTDVFGDLTSTRFRINDGPELLLGVCGVHNAVNAAAAVAIGRRLGLSADGLADALASFRATDMRLNVVRHGSVTVIDDSYNANPASVEAAIELLAGTPGRRRVLVIGDMLELGSETDQWHRHIGACAARAGVDLVIAVGAQADAVLAGVQAARSPAECAGYADAGLAGEALSQWLRSGDVVLVKGSRVVGMERVADAAAACVAAHPMPATAP